MQESQKADAPAGEEAQQDPDPEVTALIEFEPVPRKRDVEGGWTPELQRQFITRLARHGSATKACDEMGKNQTGIMKLYRSPLGESFRKAWDGAVEPAKRRQAERAQATPVQPGTMPPTIDHRFRHQPAPPPGQVRNERGEWEDVASFQQRGEEAKDSINAKLRRARRLFLHDISDDPAKRAAFEILTSLPIDWDKAAQCLPQDDEPWRKPRMVEPQMLLTAEAGWVGGDILFGPDKKAELLAEVNQWRAKRGLPEVCWKDDPRAGEEIPADEW